MIPEKETPKLVKRLIKKAFWVRDPGCFFSPAYKTHRWDGYHKFYDEASQLFPAGLIDKLKKEAKKLGIVVNATPFFLEGGHLEDIQPIPPDYLKEITLREFQRDAIFKMLTHRRGIVNAATNSGKTEMGSAVIQALKHLSVLWVVHRRGLVIQSAERIRKRTGLDVTIFEGEEYQPGSIRITTSQNLYAKKSRGRSAVKHAEVLILDECHNLTPKLYKLLMHSDAIYKWGLSGTPDKGDPVAYTRLEALFGGEIVNISNTQLIEKGFSVKPSVFTVPYGEDTILNPDVVDWDDIEEVSYSQIYDVAISQNEKRHQVIIDLVNTLKKEDFPVLVIVNRIAHGESLERIFKDTTSLNTAFSSGDTSEEIRQDVLTKMGKRALDVGIATIIFDEGVDVPEIRTLVFAAAGRSRRQLLQRVGRGLRTASGKETVKIFDIIDYTSDHFLEQGLSRIEEYKKQGFTLKEFSFEKSLE